MNTLVKINNFKFWCEKVLPLVYDDSLSYYEVLCKVVNKLNEVISDVNLIPDYINSVIDERLSDEHLSELIRDAINYLEDSITDNNESTNTNFSSPYEKGDLVWWNDKLYTLLKDVDAGDTILDSGVDPNVSLTNVEDIINVFTNKILDCVTLNNEGFNTNASKNYTQDDWLWIEDKLYLVLTHISEGTAFIKTGSNRNVRGVTLEELYLIHTNAIAELNQLWNIIGSLSNLNTTNKSSIVGAINEVTDDWICYRNVKRYGAVGDGVTDDTEAIQSAIDDGAGVIYFPPGVYVVTSTLSVTTNGITLLGSGFTPLDEPALNQGDATVLLSMFNGHVVEVARTAYHFTMKGFRIHKPNAIVDGTNANNVGVYLKNWVWFYHLEDIYVTNMYYGIASGGTNFALIKHCICRSNFKHGFYFNNKLEDEFAIDATRAMQVDVIDCLSENNDGSGFYYEHGNTEATGSMPVGAFVNNKTFANKEYGVLFMGQDGVRCISAVRCSNLFLGNDGKGCLIIKWVAFPSTFEHLQVEQAGLGNCGRGMASSGSPSFGVTVNTGSINASFNNCMFSGNTRSGIYIGAELTKLIGCTFYNNNRAERAGEGSVLSASTNSIINGCSFSETSNGVSFSVDNNSIVTSNNFYHVSGVPISGHTTYITQANNVMPS